MQILALSGFLTAPAAAEPRIDIAPRHVDFGVQPFESETLRSFLVTNTGDTAVFVTVEQVRVGDDFSPGQVTSTCTLGSETRLEPGESCVHDVGFRPSEFFAGFELAILSVTAREDGTSHESTRRVTLTGFGVEPDAVGFDRVIDFSEPGEGTFDRRFFDRDGVRFTEGDFVGFVQGDEALVGPIRFSVYAPPDRAVVSFAPAVQGTAWYQLTALGAHDHVLASARVLVTQDTGVSPDPFGYVDLELPDIPAGTRVLTLTNEFVGSSFPHITHIDFAVAQIWLFAD